MAEPLGPARPSRKIKLETYQARNEASGDLADQAPDEEVSECPSKREKARPNIWPVLVIRHSVVLLDRRYRVTYGGPNPPVPTPTPVLLSLGGEADVDEYPGNGTLTLAAGAVSLYADALALHPVALPSVLNADALRAGVTLYALGDARGAATLQLALDPADGYEVDPPAQATSTVVELTLTPYGYLPEERALTERRKIVNGKVAAVPPAHGRAFRSKVRAAPSSAPDGARQLYLHASGGGIRLYDEAHDRMSQAIADQQTDLRMEGSAAGAAVWVGLGLELEDGTRLLYGDCFRATPTTQGATSVGYEWENKGLKVDRRFVNDREAAGRLGADEWEGAPSKVTVYSKNGGRMKLDTEVSSDHPPYTYGEFVLGPVYTFADLETQLASLKTFYKAVDLHKVLVTTVPGALHAGDPPAVWMSAGRNIAVELDGRWGGTAQASVALPLFMLPSYLASYDAGEGRDAQRDAEDAAEAATAVDDSVMGLIAAVQYYVRLLRNRAAVNDDDGPKVATPIMFRTDFHSMYASLSAAQQGAFDVWAGAHGQRGDRLLPNGYKVGDGFQDRGPTIGTWLDSIRVPDHGKDAMSPPPGFARHHTNPAIPYGMGVLGVDGTTGNVITEYRPFAANLAGFNAFCAAVLRWANDLLLPGAQTWAVGEVTREYGPVPEVLPPRRRVAAVPYTVAP